MIKPGNKTLIVLDIDNTINTKNLSGDIQLVKEFVEFHSKVSLRKDIKMAYNTTRGISRVLEMLKKEQEYFGNGIISALNGSIIYDLREMKQLEGHIIVTEIRKSIADWLKKNKDITFMACYTNNDIYGRVYLKDPSSVNEFYKLHEFSFNNDRARCISDVDTYASWIENSNINMIEFKTANENVTNNYLIGNENISFSFDGHFYINPKDIDKGSGLRDLRKFLYDEDDSVDVIVAGDSKTDLAMFNDLNYINIVVGEKLQINEGLSYTRVKDPKELCDLLNQLIL